MEKEVARYKVLLDNKWDLEDLYIFPRTYAQVYYLHYALLNQADEFLTELITYAFSTYPWQGGYSAVNFYNRLKSMVHKKHRPIIISMQYASPGWIELSLIPVIALGVAKAVKMICSSVNEINKTYSDIQKGLSDRKLLRLNITEKEIDIDKKRIELEIQHMDFINESATKMGELLGFDSMDHIDAITGSRLKTLKILSSYYRRLKILTDFQRKGKIGLF